jgi:endonuclease/exonuclease/phosphatase family metal-dependent hydrolase
MTFNLQDGAGVHPLGSGSSVHMERFADLVELIKSVNPDILGMQEVSGWEYGNPSIIDQFSKEIGMKYYLAHSINNYLHLAIFTKLPILETRNYSNYIGNNGALRAVLQTPLGNKLNVVVVHLDASGHFPHDCQYNKLRRIMEAYTSSPSILMGDTNSLPDSFEAKYLTQGGWELAQSHFIDNIFVLSRQAWSATPICFTTNRNTPGCVLDIGLSDHEPVGATISFYISQNTNYQTFSPTPLPLNGCY